MDVPNNHVTTVELRSHFKNECWRLMGHTDTDISRFAEVAEVILKHLEEILDKENGKIASLPVLHLPHSAEPENI